MNGLNYPTGLQPHSYMNGTTWSGQVDVKPLASGYATSLFCGDPIVVGADGKIAIATGVADGVFWGVSYRDSHNMPIWSPYWAANTVTYGAVDVEASVIIDPNVLYDIQVSTATGTPGPVAAPSLVQSDMGRNAAFSITANSFNAIGGVTPASNPTSGNIVTGNSGYYLNYGSLGTTATLSLKLIKFTPRDGNVAGVVFNNVLVKFNNIKSQGGTGTVGTS
jgi:hypothetical protein